MAINLLDLRTAVVSAIGSIRITIDPFQPEVPAAIQPGEPFRIHFTAANTATGAIGVERLVYHVTVDGPVVVQPPRGAAVFTRASLDRAAPTLNTSNFYREMFIFPPEDDLPANQRSQMIEFTGKATELGRATIKIHPHGDVKMDEIFPLQQAGTNGSRELTAT